uniref:Uncharacterized protein n=1 Tax=Rhodnius prolixus TaxID=13249 RepID=T1IGP6_RHOPR
MKEITNLGFLNLLKLMLHHWQFLSFSILRCLDIGRCMPVFNSLLATGFRGADSNYLFHCNTLHSIDFWMGIDSTSVAGNTCKDNWTKGVKRKDSSQDVAPFTYS